jgi:hypothetical protein
MGKIFLNKLTLYFEHRFVNILSCLDLKTTNEFFTAGKKGRCKKCKKCCHSFPAKFLLTAQISREPLKRILSKSWPKVFFEKCVVASFLNNIFRKQLII